MQHLAKTLTAVFLQDHSNPVRYRNIWYRPLREYDEQ